MRRPSFDAPVLALLVFAFVFGGCASAEDEVAAAPDSALDGTSNDTATDAATDTATPVDAASDSSPGVDTSSADAATSDTSKSDAVSSADADASTHASDADAGARTSLLPQWCPSTVTAPGLYRGSLGSNLNDIPSVSGSCSFGTPGRDGAVRVELEPGQTVRAVYRHAGNGILYILDNCPVTTSCLAGSNTSDSGAESAEWTNTGSTKNPVYVVLDSDALGGAQTFELDLFVTGP